MSEPDIPIIENENAGDKNYLVLPTTELLEAFGGGNHIPGSGSAAVLSALISIEMMKTVIKLTIAKAEYLRYHEEFKYILDKIVNEYKPILIDLFHKDSQEFHKVSFFRRRRDLAEIGSKEKEKYAKEALDQLRIATELPIEVCNLSFNLLDFATIVFERGFKSAKGDAGVAISNLLSAISGSLFVIFLNLKSFKRSKWKEARMTRAVELAKKFTEVQRASFGKVIEMYNESNDVTDPQLSFDFY